MPTHASRLTRVGGLRFFSSPMDSVVTVHVTLRVEVLEDFSLISESASILSSSSELSRDNRTDPYRCGAVRSPPPLVRDLGAIVIYSTLPAHLICRKKESCSAKSGFVNKLTKTMG